MMIRSAKNGVRCLWHAPKGAHSTYLHIWHPFRLLSGAHSASARTAVAATTAAISADEHFMALALQQAQTAFDAGEVPIGAVLVINDRVAAAAYNLTETKQNPLCHAELLCISAAAEQQLAWRLPEATLYCTVEPCPMCAGAILQARLARLVYGARQPRVGADGSWVAMFPTQQQQQQQLEREKQQQQQEGIEQLDLHNSNDISQDQVQQVHDRTGDRQPDNQQQAPEPALQPLGPHPFHPSIQVTSGVMAEQCAALMKDFFRQRRQQQKAQKAAAMQQATAAAAGGTPCTCQAASSHRDQQVLPAVEQLSTAGMPPDNVEQASAGGGGAAWLWRKALTALRGLLPSLPPKR